MPGPPYKNPVCKGTYALNTACGRCEKCAFEREQIGMAKVQASMQHGMHPDVYSNFKDQLLIILVMRLGGVVDIPVEELDTKPMGHVMTLATVGVKEDPEAGIGMMTGSFQLKVSRKQ